MSSIKKMFALFLVFCMQFLTGCAQDDDGFDDESGQVAIDTGHEATLGEATAKSTSACASTPVVTVHIPFVSSETYRATTYSTHGNAWDFYDDTDGISDEGRPVAAASDGVVNGINTSCTSSSGTSCGGGWGNYIKVDHDDDTYYSRYAHLKEVYVSNGQSVRQGQVIGTLGQTGNVTGAHLHYQVEDRYGTSKLASYYYFDGSSRVSNCLTHNTFYTSYNSGVFEDTRDAPENGGTSVVGTSSPKIATQPNSNGYSKSYTGGSLGDTTIYYEALGKSSTYNNTNRTWLLQGAMRTYYYSCGGPATCSLGYPTGARTASGTGWRQTFRCGYLEESSTGNVSAVPYTCG